MGEEETDGVGCVCVSGEGGGEWSRRVGVGGRKG